MNYDQRQLAQSLKMYDHSPPFPVNITVNAFASLPSFIWRMKKKRVKHIFRVIRTEMSLDYVYCLCNCDSSTAIWLLQAESRRMTDMYQIIGASTMSINHKRNSTYFSTIFSAPTLEKSKLDLQQQCMPAHIRNNVKLLAPTRVFFCLAHDINDVQHRVLTRDTCSKVPPRPKSCYTKHCSSIPSLKISLVVRKDIKLRLLS